MGQMKAVHYEGPFKVSVKEIPRPKLEHPDDAIIKVTTSGMSLSSHLFKVIILRLLVLAICGSDLHMYQGRTAAEAGLVFG
jgi:threonine dehydrogenase-like Zn-dependent dehydrogenase